MFHLNHMYKRISHLEDQILHKLELKELNAYKKSILKNNNSVKLDPITKKPLQIPTILYPQPNVPIEWWYFTGHLKSKTNTPPNSKTTSKTTSNSNTKQLGFEFCLFKFHPQALRLLSFPLSTIRKEPFLVSHFALTDEIDNKFSYNIDSGLTSKQKVNYNQLNLSLNGSSLQFKNNKFTIKTKTKDITLNLTLKPTKKIIKHFRSGFAIMYSPPEHRTYYITYPRLKTTGILTLKNQTYTVEGQSWFDHQKMNFPHNSPLQGWDWFSIQFNDNTELMLFRLRTKKGLTTHHLGGTFIDKNSNQIYLSPKEMQIKSLSQWTSPHTNITYPSSWEIKIPKLKLIFQVTPTVQDQEIGNKNLNPLSYWEGSCNVIGKSKNKPISGQSYVELVGYDHRLSTKIIQALTK